MCIAKLGGDIGYFLQDYEGKFLTDGTVNDTFTHLWLYKRVLVSDREKRHQICTRMINRLLTEFPECEDVLSRICEIRAYLPH
jgi:hypothetical protein